MPKIHPLFDSFAAGMISPRLWLRTAIETFRNGLARCENFIPTSHGPFFRRGGFRFVETAPGTYGRNFDFEVSQSLGFVCVVTNAIFDEGEPGEQIGTLHINDHSGNIRDLGDDLVENGSFVQGETGWSTDESGNATITFTSGKCVMYSGSANARLWQSVITTVPTEEHALIINLQLPIQGNVNIRIGTTEHGADIEDLYFTGLTQLDIPFTPNVSPFFIEIDMENQETTNIIDRFSCYDPTITTPTVIEFGTDWDQEDINALQVAQPPGKYHQYWITPKKHPMKLSYNDATETWSFIEVDFTDPPTEWQEGTYPGAITFFQSRLCLAGSFENPETFWLSKTNEYENFNYGTDPETPDADDAVTGTLDRRGRILWLAGVKNLLAGTENGEYIFVSEGPILKPGDISTERQSSNGSSVMQSEQIGNQVIYVSPDGRKLREVGFQWTEEGWLSRDISFASENITSDFGLLTEVEWAKNPENLIVGRTAAGNLLFCTYERSYNIIGWSVHYSEDPILSVTVLEHFGVSEIWILTRRADDTLYLETYDQNVFTDSFLEISNPSPDTHIALPHLPNRTVSVVADGAVYPDVELDENGEGDIQQPATAVQAGLKYISTAETLPANFGAPNGASHAFFKRWIKAYVALIASHMPKINGSGSNAQVRMPADRTPSTPMDEAEPPRTEFINVSNLGYDRDGKITIVQDLPISTQISAVFGDMQQDDL